MVAASFFHRHKKFPCRRSRQKPTLPTRSSSKSDRSQTQYTISTTININSSPKKEMVEQRERRRRARATRRKGETIALFILAPLSADKNFDVPLSLSFSLPLGLQISWHRSASKAKDEDGTADSARIRHSRQVSAANSLRSSLQINTLLTMMRESDII